MLRIRSNKLYNITMDHLSKKKRSWNMSRIYSKNTLPEKKARSILHKMGYRFCLHKKSLPGKPDIVLPKYRTVIFVHGCFWHRHKGCRDTTTPKTNTAFWEAKFTYNMQRDLRHRRALKKLGWKTIIIWECELDKEEKLKNRIKRLLIQA
ncbi:MAG: DNA mismatch endonuclease Vsr [bacterium]